ncbi:GTPase IMAP family member 4-like isoform X3 [Phycodurus eques]|uniref:GTPase IMAP family member 4-like isoform X3 n=1 Tax=Phycodurus eques TaxID=693459 RepID=UPI002ACE3F71|nr:GTPase IMAP family member 4-like isoform X3 [Phycodurus eques]
MANSSLLLFNGNMTMMPLTSVLLRSVSSLGLGEPHCGDPPRYNMQQYSLRIHSDSAEQQQHTRPVCYVLSIGIQSLCKWLSRIWKFIKAFSSKFHWMLPIIRSITGSSEGSLENENIRLNLSSPLKAGLRLILVGPAGGGRTSVANTLLGCSAEQPEEHLMESTKRRAIVDGRELTVVDTPDILGVSLGRITRAKEGLRSVQLVGPGPHAVLLVMQAPRSSNETHQETMQVIQAILDLFGDGIRGHVIPVLTHADRLGRRHTFERLLDTDVGGVKRLTSLCGQRPELLDTRPDRSPEEQSVTRRLLVGRVLELKGLWGHFIHELQRRDERIREELLADMTSALSRKLGHM